MCTHVSVHLCEIYATHNTVISPFNKHQNTKLPHHNILLSALSVYRTASYKKVGLWNTNVTKITINVTKPVKLPKNIHGMHRCMGNVRDGEKCKGIMKIHKGVPITQKYNNVHTVMVCWERNPMNKNQIYEPLQPLNPSPTVAASQCIPHLSCKKVPWKAYFKC